MLLSFKIFHENPFISSPEEESVALPADDSDKSTIAEDVSLPVPLAWNYYFNQPSRPLTRDLPTLQELFSAHNLRNIIEHGREQQNLPTFPTYKPSPLFDRVLIVWNTFVDV